MRWFANLFKYKSPPGIRLDYDNAWEVSPPKDIPAFVRRLPQIMPVGGIVYLEGTSTPRRVARVLEGMECEPQDLVARGTIWPKPRCFHIPMTEENLNTIADLFEENAPTEICHHFHVYAEHKVLLEWHDAFFDDPFLVDAQISEEKLLSFSSSINSNYKKATGSG